MSKTTVDLTPELRTQLEAHQHKTKKPLGACMRDLLTKALAQEILSTDDSVKARDREIRLLQIKIEEKEQEVERLRHAKTQLETFKEEVPLSVGSDGLTDAQFEERVNAATLRT
jgi:predicted RNase H-like nuclease (RuvC/YqgF family)